MVRFGPYLLSDLQSPLAEGLSLLVFASLAVEHGQVVEGRSHSRVVLPQRLLSDGQGIVQKVSSFFIFVLVSGRNKNSLN